MGTTSVTTPDGNVIKVQHPDGATEEQIIAYAQQNYQPGQSEQDAYGSYHEALRRGLTNAGEAVADTFTQPFNALKNAAGLAAAYGQTDSFDQQLNTMGEVAASANRVAAGTVDFVGPDTANAALSLAGSERRVPTIRETLAPTGIEGGFMEPGLGRDIAIGAGQGITAAGGMMQVPRNLAKAGPALAEIAGFGSAAPSAQVAQKLALLRNTGDTNTAKVMLDEAGDVVADPGAKATVWQGFDEGLVAAIKGTSAKTRQKLLGMLDIVEKGKANKKYAASNRPWQVAGGSILDRVNVLWEANRVARSRMDDVAKGLKAGQADFSPAVDSFLKEIDNMGIKFDPKRRIISFADSDIDDLKGPQKAVTRIINKMLRTKTPDAYTQPSPYEVHRLKRYIDEILDYGKRKQGLTGNTERILGGLRHDLDTILDTSFPEYNQVNTQFAETRRTLDALQDVAGTKMDLEGANAHSALGSLTRRLLSNYQSRVPLLDALTQLDGTAKKYATGQGKELVPYRKILDSRKVKIPDFSDDMIEQAMFASELDEMFGTHARTSFQAEIEKGAGIATKGREAATDAVRYAAKKAARINDERAIEAMRELLSRGM